MIDARAVKSWEAESDALRDEIIKRNQRIAELEKGLREAFERLIVARNSKDQEQLQDAIDFIGGLLPSED